MRSVGYTLGNRDSQAQGSIPPIRWEDQIGKDGISLRMTAIRAAVYAVVSRRFSGPRHRHDKGSVGRRDSVVLRIEPPGWYPSMSTGLATTAS